MAVTVSGIVISINDEQSQKAASPIVIISLIIPNSAVTAFKAIFVSYLLATH